MKSLLFALTNDCFSFSESSKTSSLKACIEHVYNMTLTKKEKKREIKSKTKQKQRNYFCSNAKCMLVCHEVHATTCIKYTFDCILISCSGSENVLN